MAIRQLSKYFGSYTLGKWEKATHKSIIDILDIGNLEINKILEIVKLGNSDSKTTCDDAQAGDILDDYLKTNPDSTIMDAYFVLLKEFDMDKGLLRTCGIKVDDIIADFKADMQKVADEKKAAMISQVDNVEKVEAEVVIPEENKPDNVTVLADVNK